MNTLEALIVNIIQSRRDSGVFFIELPISASPRSRPNPWLRMPSTGLMNSHKIMKYLEIVQELPNPNYDKITIDLG